MQQKHLEQRQVHPNYRGLGMLGDEEVPLWNFFAPKKIDDLKYVYKKVQTVGNYLTKKETNDSETCTLLLL